VSRIEYEDPRIAKVLSGFGLSSRDDAANDSPALVLAWSPRAALELRPEYAFLSHRSVAFLQLPQPLGVLKERFKQASRPADSDAGLGALCTPLGQWQWALMSLKSSVEKADKAQAVMRLVALQRFVRKHWPGWYDQALIKLRERIETDSDICEGVNILSKRANEVAIAEACRPLMAWIEEETRSTRLGIFLDAACYASQGLLANTSAESTAADDRWWTDFAPDLSITEESLGRVRTGGGSPESIVGDQLREIRRCLAYFGGIEAGTENLAREAATDVYKQADSFVRSIGDIVRIRNRIQGFLRMQLEEV
jgi:hypothetical protein